MESKLRSKSMVFGRLNSRVALPRAPRCVAGGVAEGWGGERRSFAMSDDRTSDPGVLLLHKARRSFPVLGRLRWRKAQPARALCVSTDEVHTTLPRHHAGWLVSPTTLDPFFKLMLGARRERQLTCKCSLKE